MRWRCPSPNPGQPWSSVGIGGSNWKQDTSELLQGIRGILILWVYFSHMGIDKGLVVTVGGWGDGVSSARTELINKRGRTLAWLELT